jgi:hypothetical protein
LSEAVTPLIVCPRCDIQIKMMSAAERYRFQRQMPPDLQGQT